MTITKQRKQITAKYSGKCIDCGGVVLSGTQCSWAQGEGVRHLKCPAAEVASNNSVPATSNGTVSVTMGVFKKDGRIYVVKPNRERTRVYAKEIVESPARMTENGLVADFTTVYSPGIVFKLTEADRWQLADAKDFLTRFAKCIVCGRHLKAAKSVAGSIGPVCAKYFAHSHACDDKPVVKLAQVKAQAELDTDDAAKRGAIAQQISVEDSSHANGCAHHGSAAPDGAVAAVQPQREAGLEDAIRITKAAAARADHMQALRALPLTADEQEMLAEIRRMNVESKAWMDANPGSWASQLTEDIAHWRDSGITSVAAFDAMEAAEAAKERRKAAYDYGDDYGVAQPTVAASDAALLGGRIKGVKPNNINGSFRLAALQLRNS
jgi:hypothetical protein